MRHSGSRLIALVVMAAMVLALATPAVANHRFDGDDDEDCFFFDGVLICDDDFVDRDDFDGDDFDGFDAFGGDFDQDVEQEAESADIDQSFDVSSTGDNSNQCVGIQGVTNTGNTQSTGSFGLLGGDDFDDFEIDDGGADIEVNGTSDTSCDQQVNQAAAASA